MDPEVIATLNGGVGVIILDRPRALNALTLPMIRQIRSALEDWRHASAVRAVILKSAGKAFCAGGDIRAVREASLAGEHERNEAFFSEEYDLVHAIGTYPKPYVALIDGVAMGGGLGLSINGRYRVVTERALLAMPETAIGFFPDVGASYFLPRLPGGIGLYLGLTGARIGAADAVYCGLATHHLSSSELSGLEEEIIRHPDAIEGILAERQNPGGPAPLADRRELLDRSFSAGDRQALIQACEESASDWGVETAATLRSVSPQSLDVTMDLLRRGVGQSLRACLDRELVLTRKITRSDDFLEGVRAMLVDKDRQPRWRTT
ncbi:enoyl-CoA hydratase/isomerase family protein [Telmatospirillum siberiense]|uniref:3-hydroxyisobutyryl-CoA hydrolase n=1 Tax=Telmatospirillum siberiense TaxID=382514 RepID=A0A2N3Q1N1_9PROT|nr:enoyl-CoA hydratase/isomerase family protein [Telmatospirillum siberiense]PKU26570.1 enoyl-CoA hydratase [Telmatospirillum siberiense]